MSPETPQTPEKRPAGKLKLAAVKEKFTMLPKAKKIMVIVVSIIILAGLAVVVIATLTSGKPKGPQQNTTGRQTGSDVPGQQSSAGPLATDPVARGKYLSKNGCTGTGSKKLGSAPMRAADLSVILPYGLVAGGHVTPVDHQYYFGKNLSAAPSTYDVLAPGDGTLTNVEVRPRGGDKYDVRGVISYSCTFFSYFDLANSLAPEIDAKMPAGWKTANGPQAVSIPVKQGQVVAKVGGQSLDFAVWDTTKTLKGMLVPTAYNIYEPWKMNTVLPTDYFTDAATNTVLPFYARTAQPRDGIIGHDVDGAASGNWFKSGTNGYIGAFKDSEFNPMSYADGHLSIAPDLYDGDGWVFSTGAVNHGTQYGIKTPSITADKLTQSSGIVKYELTNLEHVDETGNVWLGGSVPKSIKLNTTGDTKGTVLLQMTGKRELKVELVLGVKPSQVSGFTSAAATYTRGDGAKLMVNQ